MPMPVAAAGSTGPARARLHDLRPHARRLGARRHQHRARRPRPRRAHRPRVRGRPRAARGGRRAVRRHALRRGSARGDGRAAADPARSAARRRGRARASARSCSARRWPRRPATPVAEPATDPSVAGDDVAWQVPGGPGDAAAPRLPEGAARARPRGGRRPRGWRNDRQSRVEPALRCAASSGVRSWVSTSCRCRTAGSRSAASAPTAARTSARSASRGRAGSLRRERAPRASSSAGRRSPANASSSTAPAPTAARSSRRTSPTAKVQTLVRSRTVQLLHPSIRNGGLVYVFVSSCRQELRLARTDGSGARVLARYGPLFARDRGHEDGHTHQGSRASRAPREAGRSRAPSCSGPSRCRTARRSSRAYAGRPACRRSCACRAASSPDQTTTLTSTVRSRGRSSKSRRTIYCHVPSKQAARLERDRLRWADDRRAHVSVRVRVVVQPVVLLVAIGAGSAGRASCAGRTRCRARSRSS